MDASIQQVCTFRLQDLQMGVPIESVREILKPQEVFPVPLAPPSLAGIMSVRGQIVTVIDARRRFDLDPAHHDTPSHHIVLEFEDDQYSLLVDAVGNIHDLEREVLDPVPRTVERPRRHLVDSVCELNDEWLFLADVSNVLDLVEETDDGHRQERRR
ncbi:MAG: chemotaxis protein CheW [Bradymonadaceae bacterium]